VSLVSLCSVAAVEFIYTSYFDDGVQGSQARFFTFPCNGHNSYSIATLCAVRYIHDIFTGLEAACCVVKS
jgi:hypothetical protein